MLHTHEMAPDYVGDKLNCTNCHFSGRNTVGGAQGGISLVGSATRYPRYEESVKRVITLAERINSCFTNSMSGKPLPKDGETMLSLLTSYHSHEMNKDYSSGRLNAVCKILPLFINKGG